MNSTTRVAVMATLLLALVAVPNTAAQETAENDRYISVTGEGKVAVMPDAMELLGAVRGDGDLAGDALTQFYAIANEAIDRLKSLEIDGMTVSPQGVTVGQTTPGLSATERLLAARSGRAPESAKVCFSQQVHIRVEGIDKWDRDELLATMVKIIDTGTEAGLTFGMPKSEIERLRSDGSSEYVRFRLMNTADVRARSRELAIKEARANAEKLAELAGVPLGRVLSIEELNIHNYASSSMRSEPNTSPSHEAIEVSATVRVKFGISVDSQ